jgi:hypothetical protein
VACEGEEDGLGSYQQRAAWPTAVCSCVGFPAGIPFVGITDRPLCVAGHNSELPKLLTGHSNKAGNRWRLSSVCGGCPTIVGNVTQDIFEKRAPHALPGQDSHRKRSGETALLFMHLWRWTTMLTQMWWVLVAGNSILVPLVWISYARNRLEITRGPHRTAHRAPLLVKFVEGFLASCRRRGGQRGQKGGGAGGDKA